MLHDSWFYDCPEEIIEPPEVQIDCDECGCHIQPMADYAEIRSLFPRTLCKRHAKELERMQAGMDEDDREGICWFVA